LAAIYSKKIKISNVKISIIPWRYLLIVSYNYPHPKLEGKSFRESRENKEVYF